MLEMAPFGGTLTVALVKEFPMKAPMARNGPAAARRGSHAFGLVRAFLA